MVRSPLTKTERVKLVERLLPEDIIRKWKEAYQIDITDEFGEIDRIHKFKCLDTGLEFYHPPEAAGSGKLYESLQEFDWYYMPNKWEHNTAASDINTTDRVLEVGCGKGEFVERLNEEGIEAEGIELNEQAVSEAQKKKRPVKKKDLLELARDRPGSYDVVCSFQVLEHILDVHSFINASLDALRPGGKLVFGVPNSGSFIRHADNDLLNQPPHHMTRWSPKVFRVLPSLFQVELQRLTLEPLAEYHLDWYAGIQRSRLISLFPGGRILKPLIYRAIHGLIVPLFRKTGAYRFFRGHTMYACFRKTSAQ